MADSFRSAAKAARDRAAAIEDKFSYLTAQPEEPKSYKIKRMSAAQLRDEAFRLACGAFVKGQTKPGARRGVMLP